MLYYVYKVESKLWDLNLIVSLLCYFSDTIMIFAQWSNYSELKSSFLNSFKIAHGIFQMSEKFQSSLGEIQEAMQMGKNRGEKLASENANLSKKLQSLAEQYQVRLVKKMIIFILF